MSMQNRNGNPLLPYSETQLPSGFTLIHKEVRTAPIVAIDIWIHTGAIHDPAPHYGLSHFYEHMFFKGTQRHGVGIMDRIITSLGGYNNAATSWDYTHYYVVLPSAGWKQALDVLIDSMLNPLFNPEELEKERCVIVEEIKRHDDNPWSKIYDEFTQAAFSPSSYRRQVLGTEESLNTITRDTFVDYQKSRYRPDNTTLVIVGDVSEHEVLDELNHLLQNESASVPVQSRESFDILDQPAEVVLQRDVNQSYLLLGYPTPRLLDTKHEYALDLLSLILGEGNSSRLHRRLHDELGIVSSINCNYWSMVHNGLFMVEAVTEPSLVEEVEKEIHSELNKVRESIREEELVKAKNMSRTDFAFANEKNVSIAHTYGYSRLASSVEHAVNYLQEIESVMLEDLHASIQGYLNNTRLCKGLLLPKGDE